MYKFMIKNTIRIATVGLALLVSGCGTAGTSGTHGTPLHTEQSQPAHSAQASPQASPSPSAIPKGQSLVPKEQLLSEEREGDFVLQVMADKSSYSQSDPVKLIIRMKYVGERSEVNISHAASAFSFLIMETTRDIGIGYMMNQPLIHKVLKQGEWLEESYIKTGGYSDSDPDKAFIQQFLQGEAFPEGTYRIIGQADFTFYQGEPDQPDTKEMDIHFQTKPIEIVVK
jgi:hypothetical protein